MRILLKLHILVFAIIAGSALHAQETPAAAPTAEAKPLWHAEQAQYRLKIHVKTPKKYTFVDDRTLCLPGSTANGMAAYDAEGKQVAVYQFEDGGFQIAQMPAEADVYLYYGFPEKIASDKNARKIQNDYLCIRDAGWDYWNDPNGWRNRIINDCTKDIENTEVMDEVRVQRQERIVEVQSWDDATVAMNYAKDMTNVSNRSTNVRMTRTYLDHRINEDSYNRIYTFSGNLKIDKAGDYSFRLFSNANHALKIDDKVLIKRFGTRPDVTSDECAVYLDTGIHLFNASYHEGNGDIRFSAEWRKPDETEFRELYDADFTPAPLPEYLELTDKDGGRYPLCGQSQSFRVFATKTDTATLRTMVPLNAESQGAYLTVDGFNCMPQPDATTFITEDKKTQQLTLNPPAGSALKAFQFTVYVDPKRHFPIPADISLQIRTPYFLYDDEVLDVEREVRTRLPRSVQAYLTADTTFLPPEKVPVRKTETSAETHTEQPLAKKQHEETMLRLPRFLSSGMDDFRQDIILKFPQEVNGREISAAPREIDYSIQVPGFTFDRKKIAYIPVDGMRKFEVGSDGALYDSDGTRRIIPLLRRLTLHELRAWQLPKSGGTKVIPTDKVLVIGEDAGSFRRNLRAELAESAVKLEFIPWARSVSGHDTLETLPAIFDALTRTDANLLLIIPPNRMRRMTIAARDEARVIAFIVETAIRRSSVSSIAISAPIPPNPAVQLTDDDANYCAELRQLKRMYDVDILEFAPEFESIFQTPGAYRMPVGEAGADASESDFPVGAGEKLAKLFADALRKKGNFLTIPFTNPIPSGNR